MKLKTYVLTVSRYFPANHKRKGEPTRFIEKILNKDPDNWTKIHTIRSNYDLWKKRIDQVNEGKAVLSLRYWTKSPYNYQKDGSKQQEFLQLKKGECGIQKIDFSDDYLYTVRIDGNRREFNGIERNDGLLSQDFENWFEEYDLSKPMAIIHFTQFRY